MPWFQYPGSSRARGISVPIHIQCCLLINLEHKYNHDSLIKPRFAQPLQSALANGKVYRRRW